MSKSVKRLYEQFQPENYNIELTIDPQGMEFSGSVVITGRKSGRPSRRLTFHQNNLKITAAAVTRHEKNGPKQIPVDRINHHSSYDEVRLHVREMLYPGSYLVRLEFSGVITRSMNGIYPCFFKHSGKDKKLIATQFESHHAREVFPGIDEPEAKATFDLTLTTPPDISVLANTPIRTQEKEKSLTTDRSTLVTTKFETTPKMSTYLLAFVFGELGFKEAKTKDGVAVRAYATPDNVKFTDFALDVAVKCLEFYNDYFGIDYPLDKCDLIALPDFAAGAMENWGCITFREQTLLVDPANSNLINKQYVAMVVAHELAHQWFGNLVTMRWWTDLWLNEGFASWIEFLAIDHIFPEWEMWTQFVVDEQQQALKLDALEHTHPIEVLVHHPDEIRSIFDTISYSKGASVIHMLYEYLGATNFRAGLGHYLKHHKYGNTDTIDLWQALEEISGQPVKKFMHAWTTQSGFPIVEVKVGDGSVSLHQERFLLNPTHGKIATKNWPVPLQTASANLPSQLADSAAVFKVADTRDFKLNVGQSGFYRVTYDSLQLIRLGEIIKKGQMKPLDRLGVLSDVFEAAKAGKSDTSIALQFLGNFFAEDNYAVWDVIASALGGLKLVMNDEQLRRDMKPFIRKLVSKELERLGWERVDKETHFDRLLRPIILGLTANSDEEWVVKRCQELFASISDVEQVKPDLRAAPSAQKIKRGADIDPDMRGVVFGTVARLGSKKEFDKLVALHNKSTLSEERTTLAAAITGFRQPELIGRALDLIDSEHVRLQDAAYWIAYSFLNRHARGQSWEWLKAHWGWLEKNLGNDLSFYRTPIYVARVHSDAGFIKEYQKFFKPKLSPALERSYKQGQEMLEWQSAWKTRDFKQVQAFFKSKNH